MGRAQRVKGHSFEREVARQLRDIFPDVMRQLEYQENTANGIDLTNTGKLRIQCKKHKNYVSINTIKEVKSKDGIPVLVTAGDREKPVACLYLEDLIKILSDISNAYG
jgi:hypothetical protein